MNGDQILYLAALLMPPAMGFWTWRFFSRHKWRPEAAGNIRALLTGNALVFATLLTLLFLAGETYYRFFYDETDSFGLTKVSTRWFERHYRENEAGVRDSIPYENAIAPGKRRISFLGDSFTAGHGLKDAEQRFANRIRKAKDREWEIHLLASNGFDTGQQLALLEDLARTPYQMDVIVLVYCLNDIADIVPEWNEILARVYAGQEEEGPLLKHSYWINTLYYRRRARRDPDVSNYYGFVKAAYENRLWTFQQQRLMEMKRRLQSRGVTFMAVTFPFLHALGPEYEYREIHHRLNEFWRKAAIPHLDLLPVFEKYPPRELVASRYDAHPNPTAHELAAEAILSFMETHLKAPAAPREAP